MNPSRLLTLVLAVTSAVVASGQPQWQPAAVDDAMGGEVMPDRVLPEYPRPQLMRRDWQNLNGLWEYGVRPRSEAAPKTFDGRILVPFPIESALSGVMKKVGEANRLWYRRTFEVPAAWRGQRTLLHFGAVDWDTTVYSTAARSARIAADTMRSPSTSPMGSPQPGHRNSWSESGILRIPALNRAASR